MVESARFERKMRAMRDVVQDKMATALERNAERVVKEMQVLLAVQYPAVFRRVEIAWTWGDAPRGSITVGTVRGNDYDQIAITIYARGKQGSGITPAWFEFGTAPRVQKTTGRRTGQITAGPFFFPAWRANKKRVRASLQTTLRNALRKINAM